MGTIDIKDTAPFEQFEVALLRFAGEADHLLEQLSRSIQKTVDHYERCEAFWVQELRERQARAASARISLTNCLRDLNDDCYSAKNRLKRCEDQVEQAQKELKTVRNWRDRITKSVSQYEKQRRRFDPGEAKQIAKHLGTSLLTAYHTRAQPYASEVSAASSSRGTTSKAKGDRFEYLFNTLLLYKELQNSARLQLRVPIEYNLHLLKHVYDYSVNRTIDVYLEDGNEIWELKSGYEAGGLKEHQAEDYAAMQAAGVVYVLGPGGKTGVVAKPVASVNYLFATQAGAQKHASTLQGLYIEVWYVDEDGKIQLLPK